MSASLLAEIRAEAFDLGFLVCGVASPSAPEHIDAYLDWLNTGRMAGMAYMARENAVAARQDPHRLLPSCHSILCLVTPYPHAGPPPDQDPEQPCGIIAAYACLPDYHEILHGRLKLLIERIQDLAGHPVECLACVDSTPILEKSYAQSAGLGWVGQNTLLNVPGLGSWVLLAELLTDLDLPITAEPLQDLCLGCSRCVDACPTQALGPDRSLDARRCLSYLTIEQRGPIPEALRAALGSHIVGCDICQSVCPANQNLLPLVDSSPLKPMLDPHPDLITDLAISEAEFKARFAGTPVMRAKFAGYRRNVAIALGNSGSRAAIPALEAALAAETDPVLRDACAWALARLQT